jgi:hypothetical protein
MPASYEIDKEQRLVMSTASGVLTVDDIWGHQKRLATDKDFDPNFSQLMDFNGVTEVAFETDDVRKFAETSIFSPNSRRALVVQRNDLVFGFSRMFEMLRSLRGDQSIRVFRNRNEALGWLFSRQDP